MGKMVGGEIANLRNGRSGKWRKGEVEGVGKKMGGVVVEEKAGG